MKCPYCGSKNIIWNEESGEVVCANCGAVLDRIYYAGSYQGDSETVTIPKSAFPDFYKKVERIKKWRRPAMKRRVVLYNGRYIRELSLNAVKIIESDEKYLILYDIIDSLPEFRGRDIRYKLAVGLYLFNKNEFEKLKPLLGISEDYMEKLLSKLKVKDREKIRKLLKEKLSEIWH